MPEKVKYLISSSEKLKQEVSGYLRTSEVGKSKIETCIIGIE